MTPGGEYGIPRQFDGHLVLVGLPGAGKSTIGRSVAKRLHRPFLDFDAEIERREGQSVARLFSGLGEPAFRALEVALTRELAAAPPMVLAPGGGWVTSPGIMDLIRPPARIVHLRVSPAEALRRLARARVVRPLLQGADPSAKMSQLWNDRAPLYALADLEIDVERVDSQRVITTIVELAGLTPELG